MADSITTRVLDALANAGLLTIEQIGSVNEAADSAGITAGDVLIKRAIVTPADVETALEEELGIPRVDLSSYAPDDGALKLVPIDVARQHCVLPLFEIESMLTVAIGDPMDIFKLDELATLLGLEIEAVLSDAESVSAAISQYYGIAAEEAAEVPAEETAEAPAETLAEETPLEEELPAGSLLGAPEAPVVEAEDLFAPAPEAEAPVVAEAVPEHAEAEGQEPARTIEQVVETAVSSGPPAIDLDVLAVADVAKVALLVSDILELAVDRGASRIHLLPYKNDFFLVFRIQGRLEKVASAPLSMEAALVDGFKAFGRLGAVSSTVPALGRVKSHIGDRDLVVTVSAVPTVAGQRVVITLASDRGEARTLSQLGMNEAEERALHAMIERGRGILLVCAPVAGGRSSTYYALLQHAAQAGKTAYSVERSVEYEIPAVAQVLVNPGSSVGAASYFAAGIRQDTDVMAIDPIQTVEDVHLAIEAAGLGKLVIATFSAGDIVSGVHRMLDLGAEPVSLAAALTLGVGQRLVRKNCPQCSAEEPGQLASLIPGVDTDVTSMRGQGCPACANTGFQGATGVFEVLPFTELVRGPISHGAPADQIAQAAHAAGMRPMAVSGLAKVREGLVSAEELNRVLRFADG